MINKVLLQGNIGQEPEIKDVNGLLIAEFSLAVGDMVKGEKKTYWIKCVGFNKTAELVQANLDKGDQIIVEGKFTLDEWEKDGETKRAPKVVINQLHFIKLKKWSGDQQGEFDL